LDKETLNSLRMDRDAAARDAAQRFRPWVWAGAAVLVLLIAAGVWQVLRTPAIAVEVATARAEQTGGTPATGGAILNASGYVVARRVATVSSKVTGQLTEVLVEEGMAVKEGQVLARLDDRIARAQLALAQSRLDTARASVEEVEVRYAEAQRNLRRNTALREQGLVSQAVLDAARAEDAAQAARLDVVRSEVKTAERNLALSQRNLDEMTVRAPFAGMVTIKNDQPGEIVSPVSAGGGFTRIGIATIVDMASLEIEVDVNESYINRVTEGQPVEAVLNAYPDWRIPARVLSIVPTADRQKATVKVRIAFEQLDPRILPEMGVQVWFMEQAAQADKQIAATNRLVWVPQAALQSADGMDIVFVVQEGRSERRAVRVQQRRGAEVAISAGLNGGEQVVIKAAAELTDGAAVQISEDGV